MSSQIQTTQHGKIFPEFIGDFFDHDRFLLDFNGRLFHEIQHGGEVAIVEDEKTYEIALEIPGMDKTDFKIELWDDVLMVSAEKDSHKTSDKKDQHQTEFSHYDFCRYFTLPGNLLAEQIEATYDDGVLRLSLPKSETKAEPIQVIRVR